MRVHYTSLNVTITFLHTVGLSECILSNPATYILVNLSTQTMNFVATQEEQNIPFSHPTKPPRKKNKQHLSIHQ